MTINLCGDCRHYRLRMSEAPCASCSISDSKWEPVMFDKLFTKKPGERHPLDKPGERHPLDKPGERHPLDNTTLGVFDPSVPGMFRPTDPPLYRPLDQAPPATARQEGGDHYKAMAIQPFEYIHANSIPFAEGCVIKYVSRWRAKGGVEDLRKARHFLDLLIEAESDNRPPR